ncbi:patatin-like phospholipase family protein [Rhodobacteraceae bacterium NNCM2]|nr:patatin-like phospholipase family protein [Coraliihabitans acroporae]
MVQKPRSHSRRTKQYKKSINLALQGGGAHGAFTWGVLDKLFEDDRIWIDAISGTSAGAMNAVVAAQGMYEDGDEGARRRLHEFWKATSEAGRTSPIQRSVWAHITGDWSLNSSPGYQFFSSLERFASPYDLNLLDINPLRDLVDNMIDFDKVRGCSEMGIFIAATNVTNGCSRVFEREEITLDAVMASACLPTIYKAVEIDGIPYWDGGFTGNPPLFPFFYNSPSNDIVIVQINPVFRQETPRSAQEIQNRLNEITFNTSLLNELRSIDFVRRLLDNGKLEEDSYRRMHIHVVHARKKMRQLDSSSKLNAEWSFLRYLFDIGRDAAEKWLEEHFDDLGERSSVDPRHIFEGKAGLPDRST